MSQVAKDNAWLSSALAALQAAGAVSLGPWLLVAGGGATAALAAVVLVKRIKERKMGKAQVMEIAIANGVPDAEEFASFTYRASRLTLEQLVSIVTRLTKKLDRRKSERVRERISAKLRIAGAFSLVAAAEEEAAAKEAEVDSLGYQRGQIRRRWAQRHGPVLDAGGPGAWLLPFLSDQPMSRARVDLVANMGQALASMGFRL